jgi:hypothetical protein
MKQSLQAQLAFGILSASTIPILAGERASKPMPGRPLCVHVYNLADIPAHKLARSIEVAASLLAAAGVNTVWQHDPRDTEEAHLLDLSAPADRQNPLEPDTRDYLVVRIVAGMPVASLPGALGYAVPHAQFGVHATILYDRILERLSYSTEMNVPVILGHLMVHEIGHVLLGSMEHFPAGIMKAHWGNTDFRQASQGYKLFTPQQSKVIRERALIRVAAGLHEPPQTIAMLEQ